MNWVSPNFSFLHWAIKNKSGALLEGSSRSTKTIASIDFIIYLCARVEHYATFNLVRQTYNSHKTTLYDDFNKRLHDFGLISPFDSSKEVPSFKILGNKVNFLGADNADKFQGAGSDYWFFNEILNIPKLIFDNAEQRCRKFWWGDFNPRFSQHWVFENIMKRDDVGYIHTTFKDNPFISPIELKKILSYDPNNPENIRNGTADDYMWKVYGLGLRCAQTGLIFPYVNWITEFPTDIERVWYGLDFGFTNEPSALVKIAQKGNDLYFQELLYSPTDNSELLFLILNPLVGKNVVWADSADRYVGNQGSEGMVKELQKKGLRVFKAKKFAGSIQFGFDIMKRFKINIVKTNNFLKEQENYCWRTINGIEINEPIGDFDHCFHKDTLILTDVGYKKISKIREGSSVITSAGVNKVLKSFISGYYRVREYKLKFSNFTITLKCTQNHKIKTVNGWQEIGKLNPGERIYLNRYLTEKYTDFTQRSGIIPGDQKDFILRCGNTIMGRFLNHIAYIIKTSIQPIIKLKIWNLKIVASIKANISEKDSKKIRNTFQNFCQAISIHQWSGIKLRKESNTIKEMQYFQILGKGHMGCRPAWFAEQNLKRNLQMQSSVQINVNQNTEEILDWILFPECAFNAGRKYLSINMNQQNIVRESVLMSIEEKKVSKEYVYDLTIENQHEFFANGILVHNCWSAARYGCQMELAKRRGFTI